MKSNSRQIGVVCVRSLANTRCLPSCSRSFAFSSSPSFLLLASSFASSSKHSFVPHRSFHLSHSSASAPTLFLCRRSFSSSSPPHNSSKPTFYDNVHQNYNIAHDINQEINNKDIIKNPSLTPLSTMDAIERDEFLPPPSSAPGWAGALNPDGDERDCTGKDPPKRSKFLLVKHSTLMRMQHLVWIIIAAFFINSFFTERKMAHAEEKPGSMAPPANGSPFTKLSKWLESTFGYYITSLNEKVGFGGHSMLLPPQQPDPYGRPVRTVVVNFEKTLVSSEWTRDSGWVLSKRPYVNYFLERLSRAGYEVVLFTDMNVFDCEGSIHDLDQTGVFRHRLFKEATNVAKFHFVKDLNRLGRDLKNVVMIDHSSATSGILTPDNCLPISAWTGDLSDKELYSLAVLLEKCQKYNVADMREIVKRYRANPKGNPFVEEENRAQEQERLLREEEGSWSSKDSRKTSPTDSNKSGGGIGAAISGLFGRK